LAVGMRVLHRLPDLPSKVVIQEHKSPFEHEPAASEGSLNEVTR
jgi:hypothetical protein